MHMPRNLIIGPDDDDMYWTGRMADTGETVVFTSPVHNCSHSVVSKMKRDPVDLEKMQTGSALMELHQDNRISDKMFLASVREKAADLASAYDCSDRRDLNDPWSLMYETQYRPPAEDDDDEGDCEA